MEKLTYWNVKELDLKTRICSQSLYDLKFFTSITYNEKRMSSENNHIDDMKYDVQYRLRIHLHDESASIT